MSTTFDVDAYLARVDWHGSRKPTVETLNGLVNAHIATIPFENIDILLGRRAPLQPELLQEKMVRNRRGGQCIEQSSLLLGILKALGFEVQGHLGRAVMFGSPARVHMFLTVRAEGASFVVDPGLGQFSTRIPVLLAEGGIADEANTEHRMSRQGNHWTLHIRRDGEMIPGWIATLEEDLPIDFRIANYWVSTHPGSPFRRSLILSAATPDGWVCVMDRNVTVTRGPHVTTWELTDKRELRSLLAQHFGFDLAEVEQIRVPAIPEW